MPFRRTRRTRRRRRRPTRGGGKAMRAVRTLSKFVDRELHLVDSITQINQQDLSTFTLLNGISEGADPVDRLGSRATMRSIVVRQHIVVGNQDATIRVTIVFDKQANATIPVSADLYQNIGTPAERITSPFNNDKRKRWIVLFDRVINVNNVDRPRLHWRWSRKLSQQVSYRAGGPTFADIDKNSLWLIMFSTTAGGANSPQLTTQSRVRFAP